MPLPIQTAYFPFGQGLDTKTDPKQVLPGKLLKLQNGFFQTPQMIRKRYGFTALPTTITNHPLVPNITAGQAISSYKNELVMTDGSNLFSWSPSQQGWANKGTFIPTQVIAASVQHDYNNNSATSAYSSSAKMFCYAWRRVSGSVGGVWYSVVDAVTGQTIVSSTVADTQGVSPKVFLLGSDFLVVWYDNTGTLKYLQVPTGNPGAGNSSVTITTGLATASIGAWEGSVNGSQLYLAYAKTSDIGLRTITAGTLTVSSETVATGTFDSGTISFDSSNQVYVAFYNGTNVQGMVYNAALSTQILAPTSLTGALSNVGAMGSVNVGSVTYTYIQVNQTNTYDSYVYYATWESGFAVTSGVTIRSLQLASQPFLYNGTQYILAVYFSNLQPTYFLLAVNGPTATVVARIQSNAAGQVRSPQLTTPQQVSTGVYQFAVLAIDQAAAEGGASPQITYKWGVSSAQVSFGTASQGVEIANTLNFAGGLCLTYDGVQVVENNFHMYPEQSPAPSISTSGGSAGAGQYQTCAVYEWTDAQGQLNQSAASVATTFSLTGTTNELTHTIPCLRVTSKTSVTIGLYRTAGNGTIFYRVNSLGNYIFNDPTVDSVTYTEGVADSTLAGNEQLYLTSGEVDNSAPPALLAIANYKNRLFGICAETPNQLWYTKEVIPGQPIEFSAFFTQNLDPRGGGAVALAQMDGNLIILKTGGFLGLYGDGPTLSGLNNDYGDAQLITADEGALSQASVVSTNSGIMYQASKGIMLLDRSLNTSYIGAPEEGLVQGNLVTAATLYPLYNQVRFTLSSGVAAVYDYLMGQWSEYTDIAAVGSCLFNGTYCYLQSDGTVLQESASVFTDNGTFYPLLIQTSWLSFAGIQGYQRVREMEILGDWKSAHTLQLQVAYDGNPAVLQTTLITASSSVLSYEYRAKFAIQKSSKLQLTLQDTQTAPYGEGLDLSGLAFEIAIKGGLNRKSSNRTFG